MARTVQAPYRTHHKRKQRKVSVLGSCKHCHLGEISNRAQPWAPSSAIQPPSNRSSERTGPAVTVDSHRRTVRRSDSWCGSQSGATSPILWHFGDTHLEEICRSAQVHGCPPSRAAGPLSAAAPLHCPSRGAICSARTGCRDLPDAVPRLLPSSACRPARNSWIRRSRPRTSWPSSSTRYACRRFWLALCCGACGGEARC